MNYQTFLQELPNLYHNWGTAQINPKNDVFQEIINQIQSSSTANILQLINFAVEYLENEQIYCQIGCDSGINLIAALINHPDTIVYAVDSNDESEFLDSLNNNISAFGMEEQILFLNQKAEEFFTELTQVDDQPKIGVYFLNNHDNYRTALLLLLLVKPFLSEQALIIIDGGKAHYIQQAMLDFMKINPQADLLLELPNFDNVVYVLSWNEQQLNSNITEIKQTFALNHFQEAMVKFTEDFEINYKPKNVDILEKKALGFHYTHKFKQAEIVYQQILNWDKYNGKNYHNLGMLYYQQEEWENALKFVLKSLEIINGEGLYYYSLGLILEKLGDLPQAIASYDQAININAKLINAYNNLGNILVQIGDLTAAKTVYEEAIKNNPEHFGSYINLGNILMEKNEIDSAIDIYQKAMELNPNIADTYYNLSRAFANKNNQERAIYYQGKYAYMQGDYKEAIINYEKIIDQTPEYNLYLQLTQCYKNLNNQEKTIATYQKAIKKYPEDPNLYVWLMLELQRFDCMEEAIKVADKALQLFPDHFALKLEKQKILPIIYSDPEAIEFYRQRFNQGLEEIINNLKLDTNQQKNNALQSLDFSSNFYLYYQGEVALETTKKYGDFVHKIMAANYPQWTENKPIPPLTKEGKIKIGYVSDSMYYHVVGIIFIGWLKQHNRDNFEIYCYFTNTKRDGYTTEFTLYSDKFYHIPENMPAVCEQIYQDNLHILVFLDIGMTPIMTKIAALKLAPIQCQTWGHPITSGLPTIDYFISSDIIEAENAQEHYTEKLIRLPNLAVSLYKQESADLTKKRSYFNIPEDKIVYLCCQSLFKYLPQYDYILPAIASQIPQCVFVFFKSPITNAITEKFSQRLKKAFANFDLDFDEYSIMLDKIPYKDYLNLFSVSDVFLDTFIFSGCLTTLDAIACGLPVVTSVGKFFRGRQSYGILKMLGVTETIANNEEEYIKIAVKLGLDQPWRNSIRDKIIINQPNLYEDQSCVIALEKFYQSLVTT